MNLKIPNSRQDGDGAGISGGLSRFRPKWSIVTQLFNFELLINILARSTFGTLLAMVLSFLIWWTIWFTYRTSNPNLTAFFLVQSLLVGAPAALATMFAWWNTESSKKVQWQAIGLTLVAAVVSAWLVNEIRGVETHNALFRGGVRVPVFSISHMLSGMIFGAAFGGNGAAAAFYIYRAVRYREM